MNETQLPTDALARLRRLYSNLVNGGVRDTASAKRVAESRNWMPYGVYEVFAAPPSTQPASKEQTMTEPTDSELEAFAIEEQFLLFCDVDEFTQIARAVLAKWGTPAPVGVEPVAQLEIEKTKGGVSLTHIAEPAAFQLPEGMYALYTHPPTAQTQAGAVPLTDEQIHAIYDEVAHREPYTGAVTRRNIVRAIEAAHGVRN